VTTLGTNGLKQYDAGVTPSGIAENPLSTFVYVTDKASNQLIGYVVQANGSLVPMVNGPFTTGQFPWSLTIDPIIYLPPITPTIGVYVTGGGGFYRKVTNFTAPACEEGFFGVFCENQTIAHLSSNQGGLNIGAGAYWKAFGPDSRAKLYAEARYVWVDSPSAAAENGYLAGGTEGLIPVTFGIRF